MQSDKSDLVTNRHPFGDTIYLNSKENNKGMQSY